LKGNTNNVDKKSIPKPPEWIDELTFNQMYIYMKGLSNLEGFELFFD